MFVTTCWWRHGLTHHGRCIVQAEAIELLREWSLAVVLVLLSYWEMLLTGVFEDLTAGLKWAIIAALATIMVRIVIDIF